MDGSYVEWVAYRHVKKGEARLRESVSWLSLSEGGSYANYPSPFLTCYNSNYNSSHIVGC